MEQVDVKTDAMEWRCRCPHVDHDHKKDPGVCQHKARLECPKCGTPLCLTCAASHHPRQHHAAEALGEREGVAASG